MDKLFKCHVCGKHSFETNGKCSICGSPRQAGEPGAESLARLKRAAAESCRALSELMDFVLTSEESGVATLVAGTSAWETVLGRVSENFNALVDAANSFESETKRGAADFLLSRKVGLRLVGKS